ncbi:MAG: transporter [Defluviitaleaceae bacterium]|nr:transporter [Defluviitaleaceae bacterium]
MDENRQEKEQAETKATAKIYIAMYVNFVVYSLSLAMSSWAGRFPLVSVDAAWRYFSALTLLGVYAVIWQQVLKKIPLTTAYGARGCTVLLGMLWGAVFFAEVITLQMAIGAAMVIFGMLLVVVK